MILTNNNSFREADRHVSLPDSFVSCKNASNKPNFIKIRDEAGILNNYPNKTGIMLKYDAQG